MTSLKDKEDKRIKGFIVLFPKPKPVMMMPWVIDKATIKLLKSLGIKPPRKDKS
jgi:hypothetical protein